MKPSTDLLAKVARLYEALVEQERQQGVAAGRKLLDEKLKELGFPDYAAFMTQALSAEIRSRSEHLNSSSSARAKSRDEAAQGRLVRIAGCCRAVSDLYARVFGELSSFGTSSQMLQERTARVLSACSGLRFLCVNMSVVAAQSGVAGRTIGVVAHQFQRTAEEVQERLSVFESSMKKIAGIIKQSEFDIAAARLQVDMIDFFVNETIDQGDESETAAENRRILLRLGVSYSGEVESRISQLGQLLGQFKSLAEELRSSVIGLEVVRLSGTVESTFLGDTRGAFNSHIDSMRQFIDSVRVSMKEIRDCIDALIVGTQQMRGNLSRVFSECSSISALELPPGGQPEAVPAALLTENGARDRT